MWTETARKQYRWEDLRYASDMTDAEWALIEPHMPAQKALGRPRIIALRGVVDALLYILRTACPWRLLPRHFPNRSTVQRYFYAWQGDGLWEKVNFLLVPMAREREDREASPSAGVIDSQSVKTTEKRGAFAPLDLLARVITPRATSSPIPAGIWLACKCMLLISKIAMAPLRSWPRSAISSLGCGMSLPMAPTPARNWRPLFSGTGSGRSRSSSDRTRPRVFRCCHGAGWSSEPLPGLAAIGGWPRIS
jgi:transposase